MYRLIQFVIQAVKQVGIWRVPVMIREKLRGLGKYNPDSDAGYLAPVRKTCYNLFWLTVCAVYVCGMAAFLIVGAAAVYAFCGVMMAISQVPSGSSSK